MRSNALPRFEAALQALDILRGDCIVKLTTALEPDSVKAFDALLASNLLTAARVQVAEIVKALHAAPNNALLQESGGRLIASLANHKDMRIVLLDLNTQDVLKAAIRQHPRVKGVQEHAQWGLTRLLGWQVILDVLGDPALSSSPEVVVAALWCIGSANRNHEELSLIPWAERRAIAELAKAASMRCMPECAQCDSLQAYSLDVIGLMLCATISDASHAAAAAAAPEVIAALQGTALQVRVVHESGARALARLLDGNAGAADLLRSNGKALSDFFDTCMIASESYDTLEYLCQARYAVFGSLSLLEALSRDLGTQQEAALMHAFGKYAEDCDAESLLKMDAVGVICRQGLAPNGRASAGISALGRVIEFLVQDAVHKIEQSGPYQAVIEQGVQALVLRLQEEVEASHHKPDVNVYAHALGALRNISIRSDQLAKRISASPSVIAAVDKALERDYYTLRFDSLWQLIAAVSFFSGLQKLLEFLEKYPTAPILQEVACRVLVADAEQQDGADGPGTVLQVASSLAFYATKVITDLVPDCPLPQYNPAILASRAAALLGHVLGAVPPTGPVLENGLRSLFTLLTSFPQSASLASEVCRALVRIKACGSPAAATMNSILATIGVGNIIYELVQRFLDNSEVLEDAAMAIGVLEGPAPVLQFMCSNSSSLQAQVAGCCALSEMWRMGVAGFAQFQSLEEICTTVRRAQATFPQQQAMHLHARAEVLLGMLGTHSPN